MADSGPVSAPVRGSAGARPSRWPGRESGEPGVASAPGHHARAGRGRVCRADAAATVPQSAPELAGTLAGSDALLGRSAHSAGQQCQGTAVARSGGGTKKLLRLRSHLERPLGRDALFAVRHSATMPGQRAAMADQLLPGLCESRWPSAAQHRRLATLAIPPAANPGGSLTPAVPLLIAPSCLDEGLQTSTVQAVQVRIGGPQPKKLPTGIASRRART